MRPISQRVSHSSNFIANDAYMNFGTDNTVSKIAGSTKKLGVKYQNATVILYSKLTLMPIAIKKPDAECNYEFLGLNKDILCFVVGIDLSKEYNAVIQDNVVPK